ncbi:TlpA family protein disulfide reductase [Litoribacter alkaliphilus]|uniref:TlpA family protein disulfide reductase n=1 Tax=Litoribacter ruber TaxID=702568 RepID=A0AAP2CHU2_9BACT|nr:TlpA disulfide reductase family protein [Litoribacter alkaliphilus]MBS9523904.1 TlpA family protein disulfide reductase [Litoribacter alkaliphilus]
MFDLDGKSFLTIVNESSTPLKVSFEKWSTIPSLEFEKVDTVIARSSSIDLNMDNKATDYIYLSLNGKKYDFFLVPHAVDTILYSGDDLEFSGDFAAVNRFLLQKSNDGLGFWDETRKRAEANHLSEGFHGVIETNDSITAVLKDYLYSYKGNLPKWFVSRETNRLDYKNEGSKLNSFAYRRTMLKKSDTIPAGYHEKILSTISLENEEFIGEQEYMRFLHEYLNFLDHDNPEGKFVKGEIPLSIYRAKKVEANLSGKVKDAFLANQITQIIKVARDEYDVSVLKNFQDEDFKSYVENYYAKGNILPPGSDMPYFFLSDLEGKEVEPTDFRGNVLLINFWADWCGPCIVEFPYENKLVEKYQDSPVKIINIAIESKDEKWRLLIEKHGLTTINLFANEVWTNKIKKDYKIAGVPHSVVVDYQGRIVQNNSPTARMGVEKIIDQLLEKMEVEDTNINSAVN